MSVGSYIKYMHVIELKSFGERARCKWLKESDVNTTFFHKTASMKRRLNTILSVTTDRGNIQEHFRNIFGTTNKLRLGMSCNS